MASDRSDEGGYAGLGEFEALYIMPDLAMTTVKMEGSNLLPESFKPFAQKVQTSSIFL